LEPPVFSIEKKFQKSFLFLFSNHAVFGYTVSGACGNSRRPVCIRANRLLTCKHNKNQTRAIRIRRNLKMYLHWLMNITPSAVAGNPSCGNLPRLRRIGLDGIGSAIKRDGLDRTPDAMGQTGGTGNRPIGLRFEAKPSWFCASFVA
jgi:hypothetical protein